jgi:hypothetical protein
MSCALQPNLRLGGPPTIMTDHIVPDEALPLPSGYSAWRRMHVAASSVLALIAVVHCAMTLSLYSAWTADAVWFLGTGLALLLVGSLNLSHIGVEPCRMPTTRLVRAANWVFLAFGIAATWPIPEPQAFVLVGCLAVQAVASRWTLPGSDRT